jgi:hypothetical protein
MKIAHPLESVFGLEEGLTDISQDYAVAEAVSNDLVAAQPEGPQPDHKDEDDVLIEQRIDEVYTMAIETFQQQTAYMAVIEPRYAARNAEVAANYLNIALAAANSRSKVKTDRKRANQVFIPHAGKTTNNLVIANREDILKMITLDEEKKTY